MAECALWLQNVQTVTAECEEPVQSVQSIWSVHRDGRVAHCVQSVIHTVHGVAFVVAALWWQRGHTVVTLWAQSDSVATL